MSTSYTRLLGRATQTASGDVVLYTAPPGNTVVRDLVLTNDGGPELLAAFYVAAGGVIYRLAWARLQSFSAYHLECRVSLLPGDQLVAGANNVGPWTAYATGFVFDS